MNILFLGISRWETEEIAKKRQWIWQKSVERFGYDFKYYGIGEMFRGYRHQKVDLQVEFFEKFDWKEYTHVLYTDVCDCLLLGPPQEIISKYKSMGCPPMLASASHQLANVSDDRYGTIFDGEESIYRYPHVGGYLMEIPLLVESLKRFMAEYSQHGDDCFMWYDSWRDGWFRPTLDADCEIFQVRSEEVTEIVKPDGITPRMFNAVTGSFPCIFHQSGGYFDPVNCRDEEMLVWAKKLELL
jgi:hypothetical protein